MYRVSLENLDGVFKAVGEKMSLYLPVDDESGKSSYKCYADGMKMSERLNTVRSPKDFFFPQTEDLMEFKTEGKNIEIIDTRKVSEDFVIFGIRACDVRAFDVLDKVFLVDPVDSYYATKREHGIIVSMACTRPSETCFCQSFGIDATNPQGDVVSWKTDKYVYFEKKTEKGEKFISAIASLLEECGDEEVEAQKAASGEIMKKLPLADLDVSRFGDGKTDEFFNRPEWAKLSESCLACGTCTFVCPTCQCYDIKDFKTGKGVIRYRCWDSCMYSEFTKMSAGQPRLSQKERFRQRFMHKLVYFPTNNDGMFSCVGCGRCLSRCPINMNIVKVMKTLGGHDGE